ncbi:Mpv17/PMP22 family protein [Maridesulfovibrio bastinii]|uniref:Mpv17/PMP22 family protein n=1 Tax=Maridesulfovibrio bastinii TaxID=47157 RepID=UPI000425BF8D|nr:Mpv17/PMP22 family protein [Maridesulfovibrio bastinii]
MKSTDPLAAAAIILAILFFTFVPDSIQAVGNFAESHPYVMSFLKFAILGTLGEMVALRITSKNYNMPGFGLKPRFIVWGCIGVLIHTAFIIYATGTPNFLHVLGFAIQDNALADGNFMTRLGLAFSISALMNLLFAPLFMLAHGVVSIHIEKTGGSLHGFFSPINIGNILGEIDWKMTWGFVFKKTIPFFWIPAHTITFLLPPDLRVLFAASLGVVLGVILAFASLNSVESPA